MLEAQSISTCTLATQIQWDDSIVKFFCILSNKNTYVKLEAWEDLLIHSHIPLTVARHFPYHT